MMLGVDGAAALHERFVARTVEAAAEAATGPITLWASPDERHPVLPGSGATLSAHVRSASPTAISASACMRRSRTRAAPTLVIGTDCPLLTAAHLRDAAEVLRGGVDAVIFPAEDGGYVLIGLRPADPGAVHRHGAGAPTAS